MLYLYSLFFPSMKVRLEWQSLPQGIDLKAKSTSNTFLQLSRSARVRRSFATSDYGDPNHPILKKAFAIQITARRSGKSAPSLTHSRNLSWMPTRNP